MTVPHSEKDGLLREWQHRVAEAVNGAVAADVGIYTPTLTDIAIGTGGTPANSAEWTWIGGPNAGDVGFLHVEGVIRLGTSGASVTTGTGHRITLPPGFDADLFPILGGTPDAIVGDCVLRAGGVAALGAISLMSPSLLRPLARTASGTYVGFVTLQANVPGTWTAGDTLTWSAHVRAVRA